MLIIFGELSSRTWIKLDWTFGNDTVQGSIQERYDK